MLAVYRALARCRYVPFIAVAVAGLRHRKPLALVESASILPRKRAPGRPRSVFSLETQLRAAVLHNYCKLLHIRFRAARGVLRNRCIRCIRRGRTIDP